MLLEFIRCLLLFMLLTLSLGWPLAARLPLAPLEKLIASLVCSLIALWLTGWLLHTCALPWNLLWLLPALAAAGLVWRRADLIILLRDPRVRACLGAQGLLTLWCLGWLSLVQNYSGGGWTSDWFEHWERAEFFLHRGPVEHIFLGIYPLTARPPLGNIVTAIWLQLTSADFPHYQLFSTLLGSLVFLPAALLAGRFRPRLIAGEGNIHGHIAVLAVLFMVNPLFVQNAVFPWTKLPAALLVLAALHFFLRFRDGDTPRTSALLFAIALAAALLTHYSAAPYALALGLGWVLWRPADWRRPEFLRITVLAAGAGALLLATWFGWAFATYGFTGTLSTNTSVTTVATDAGGQLMRILLNLRDTLIPHFLRSPDPELIAQTSPWGYARDWFFQSYQLNLLLALGSVGWVVVLREVWRLRRNATPVERGFWILFVGIVVVLGVAAHGARDVWGLTQICLQALILLGLAFLAARWSGLGRGWRRALVAGATLDFIAGIVLHFAVQNHALDRWLTPERNAMDIIASYNPQTMKNLIGLMVNRLDTFHNAFAPPAVTVAVMLGLLLLTALYRARSLP